MFRTLTVSAALVAATLVLAGCQSPTAASSTSTVVTLTPTPSPTSANPSTGVTYVLSHTNAPDTIETFPWQTQFTVNLKSSQKAGMKISAVTIRVQQASSGIVITPTTSDVEHYTYTSNSPSGSNRLEGNSAASLDFNVWYALPNGGKEALVTVSMSFLDDDSVSLSGVATVNVSP